MRLTLPGLLLGLAYFAHNWELMGIWSWLTATSAAGVGTALGLYGAIGWLAGALSPVLFGWVLDATGGAWQVAFASLRVVALAGPTALLLLRQRPASRLMAGGRR